MKCIIKIVSRNSDLLEEIEQNKLPCPIDHVLIGQKPELPVFNDAFAYRLLYEVEMSELAGFIAKFVPFKDKIIGFFVEAWHPVNSIQEEPMAYMG